MEDEDFGQYLNAWAEAEAEAARVLIEQLEDVGPRPYPEVEISAAGSRLRSEIGGDAVPYQLLRTAGGVDPATLPDDDRELWVTLASGVVAQYDEPATDLLDTESQAAWAVITPAEWIATVMVLLRGGPGAPVNVDALARDAIAYDLDDEEDDEPLDDDEQWFEDDTTALSTGLHTVVLLWKTLGAIDDDDRLTDLGYWGLPESLLRAWQPAN